MTVLKERVVQEPTVVVTAKRRPTWHRYAPEVLVGIAVLFNLWVLQAERLVVSYPNDSQTHLQMVEVARQMLSHGQLPFDHWYSQLSLGSPFFVQYQSASAVLTGAISLIFGAQQTFAWSLYLLVALWPLCIYLSGRLLGWGRWESGLAAALSPLLYSVTGRGFEHQAYNWLGSGLWSELWAMWTLPLALGFCWQFLTRRRYLFGAVFFLAATIAFHFLMAYLAGLLLIVMVLIRPKDLRGRLTRAGIVGVGALVSTLWVTLPLLSDAKWTALNEFQVGTTIDDSYGARTIMGWLVSGKIYDFQRYLGPIPFPIITVLVGVGLVVCLIRFRADERARLLVAIWLLSLVLYFGRPTLGPLLDLLPGSRDLLFQRYIAGVQLAGLFLAAVGVVYLVRFAWNWARHQHLEPVERLERWHWAGPLGALLVVVVVVVALMPAWSQVKTYNTNNTSWISYQRAADSLEGAQVDALLDLAQLRGGGRVYAGMPSNWGHSFLVGGVQAYIYMENTSVDAVGFTLRGFGLMTDPEAWFDQYNPGDYSVLGIRYLLLPKSMQPPVPATRLTTSGQFALWTVGTPGIVQVVDTTTPITANASDLGATTKDFLASDLPDEGIYPTIAFGGKAAAAPTLLPGEQATGPAGRVLSIHDDLFNGKASAVVVANRTSVVLLKSSFDPGWSATVDGEQVTPEMVAPALVGVTVAPGRHVVVFQYHGYGSYPILFVISFLTLLAAAIGPMLWRRSREKKGAAALSEHRQALT